MRIFPTAPTLNRTTAQRLPRVELVVVCEGKNTEPEYLKECARYYGAGTVRLRPIAAAGVPLTIVKAAINEKATLVDNHRKNKDSFEGCFKVWAIFDRDIHPNVPQALALARKFGIEVAFSNPCFELWPLLHLEEFGTQLGRHALQSRLKSKMPGYDHNDGALINFELIKHRFSEAYIRAKLHITARESERCPQGNPSTSVGILVRKIIENGKHANREMLKILDELPANSSSPRDSV